MPVAAATPFPGCLPLMTDEKEGSSVDGRSSIWRSLSSLVQVVSYYVRIDGAGQIG